MKHTQYVPAADALPRGEDKARAVQAMFDAIAPRYDVLNRVMTFGLDVRWRRRCIRALGLPAGARVLDVGCGTGDLCRELARGGLQPFGVDFSAGMLASARTRAPLGQADATHLPLAADCVDGAVSGFVLRNFVDLQAVLIELARVIRPGGRLALLEVGEPSGSLMRAGHALYFGRIVPRIGAVFSDPHAYRYLPRSMAYLPTPEALVELVRTAGFATVQRHLLSGGIAQLLVGTRR